MFANLGVVIFMLDQGHIKLFWEDNQDRCSQSKAYALRAYRPYCIRVASFFGWLDVLRKNES